MISSSLQRHTYIAHSSSSHTIRSHQSIPVSQSNHNLTSKHLHPTTSITRRHYLFASFTTTSTLFNVINIPPPSYATETFVTYTSTNQGYSLQRPASYEQVDKAGADVLFENPEKRAATLGVTVLPVMISSLDQFGTLEEAGERLLAVEKGKESTLGVEMLSQRERILIPGSLKFYDFVYELNSTRGRKRIASTVTIANKKLYIANANIPCGKVESCQYDALQIQQLLENAALSLTVTT